MNKKITVIIVTYKTKLQILQNCLNSIDKDINIIIIENSKKFEDKKVLIEKYKNLKIYCTGSNLGYAKGNNFGLKKINTKYALILNPDTICQKKFFKKLYLTISNIKEFHIIGCQYSEKLIHKQAGFFNKKNTTKFNNFTKVDWVKGFSLIINTKKFKTKKIFDENYFLFFEEIDLFKSIKKISGNVYFSKNLKIKHLGLKSSTGKTKSDLEDLDNLKNWHYMWSNFYYHKKNYGYIFSFKKNYGKLLRSLIKLFFYSFLFQEKKRNKYFFRLLGLCHSIIGNPSFFRSKNYS